MNPTEHLAHFDGAATDVPMTGLWYSHNRVAELVRAAKAEALRDAAHDLPGFGAINTHGDAAKWLRDRAALEEGR